MLAINVVGSRVVDRAQSLIVVVLLAVFAVFIAVTIVDIDLDLLAFSGYPPLSDIIASVALTFFAYLGFSVITFSVGDLRDPARELPRAMYLALGHDDRDLRPDLARRVRHAHGRRGGRLRRDRDRRGRPARARRGGLRDDGGRRAAGDRVVGERDALRLRRADRACSPRSGSSRRSSEPAHGSALTPGCSITAALVLVVANLVDLSAIASVGSACSLGIFLLVGIAGFRRRAETGRAPRSCWRRSP